MEEEAAIATPDPGHRGRTTAAWDGNIDAVEEVIDARQALAFADDEQRDSLQQLVSVTGDVNKALDLQRTAMDLARLGAWTSPRRATARQGLRRQPRHALRSCGIVLARHDGDRGARARSQRRAAGQAETYADTAQGQFIQAQTGDEQRDGGRSARCVLPVVAATGRADAGPARCRELGKVPSRRSTSATSTAGQRRSSPTSATAGRRHGRARPRQRGARGRASPGHRLRLRALHRISGTGRQGPVIDTLGDVRGASSVRRGRRHASPGQAPTGSPP